MSWSLINLLLDTALLVVFTALAWAAVVTRFVFPPGVDKRGWLLWGLDFDQWMSIEFGLLSLLALGVLFHVMFHWSWVCGVLAVRLTGDKKRRVDEGSQTLYGVGLLIVIVNVLGFAIAAAALSIQGP